MKLIYIAGKFTAPTPWQIKKNVVAAEEAGFEVASVGAMPVIPHKNTENFHGLCTPEFWYEGTLELMRRCDAVFLFNHHDYYNSKGVKAEFEEALRLQIPVFIFLDDLKAWLHGKPVIVDRTTSLGISREAAMEKAFQVNIKAFEAGER